MNLILSRTFWVFVLAAMSGGALLYISQQVQGAEKRLRVIEARAAQEQETIRVLNAEWEYLNSPARLEMLAQRYLDLVPPAGYVALSPDYLPPQDAVPIPSLPSSVVMQPVSYLSPPAKPLPPSSQNFDSLLKPQEGAR